MSCPRCNPEVVTRDGTTQLDGRATRVVVSGSMGCRTLGERWMPSGCLAYVGYALAQQGDVRAARR